MYMPVSHVVLAHVDLINALFIIHYSLLFQNKDLQIEDKGG